MKSSRNGAWRTAETQDDERHQRFHQIRASAASATHALATAGA
ncbi:hypothetical protein [Streptomyces sp. NBC_00102]|nr:hypothetical protein [Streptomyces sp. NBC_00102]MCX5395580.1 hypothetical protein [Streptomyces sp. NBC_00102]